MSTSAWLDIAQTAGVLGALAFTGFELHMRRRETRFRNYLDAIKGFVDAARLLVERPELQALYDYSGEAITKTYSELSVDERSRVHYCDMIIALCETIWLADKQGFLATDEWAYWKRWADQLKQSKEFRWTVEWVRDDYDAEFLNLLRVSHSAVHAPPPGRGSK